MNTAQFESGLWDETERPGLLFPEETHRIIQDRYYRAAQLAQGKQVLEVGAGAGLAFHYLVENSRFYLAAEYTAANVQKHLLRHRHVPGSQVIRCDAEAMPFQNHQFELVLALAMIYYLNFDAFLAEVFRVLQPGGTLFFCTSNQDVPGFVAAPYTTGYFSIPTLDQRLRQAGFDATFYGAFPTYSQQGWVNQGRALLKQMSKRLVHWLPQGATLWRRLRRQRLGMHYALPAQLDFTDFQSEPVTGLKATERDRYHRVIYVEATRSKGSG